MAGSRDGIISHKGFYTMFGQGDVLMGLCQPWSDISKTSQDPGLYTYVNQSGVPSGAMLITKPFAEHPVSFL